MAEMETGKPRLKRRDRNHILASLPPGDYRRIASKIEPFAFRKGLAIHEADGPISHVYFPRTGVASIVTRMSEGGTVEVATIGNEGIVGLSAYVGNGRSSMEVFVQIPGGAQLPGRAQGAGGAQLPSRAQVAGAQVPSRIQVSRQ